MYVGFGRYQGLDGVRDTRDWLAAWEDYGSEVEEWIDAGDHVIAVLHEHARGRRSGVRVDRRSAHLWTVRDGKLLPLRVFPTREEALAAVGLPG
jgi:ketosteroid isomerase-like protein